MGILPGIFVGELSVHNIHADGQQIAGNSLPVEIELNRSVLNRLSTTAASRGQMFFLTGRGFAGGSAKTVVSIDGTFTTQAGQIVDYTGAHALNIVPEVLAGDNLRYVMRVVSDGQGGVTGLGARPGVLRGTATPVIYWQDQQQDGVPLPAAIEFTILPQKQMVYLKYLPGFTDALREFGLRNVEHLLRERILQVVTRDYYAQGINVVFQESRPSEFVEYGVVEIGGQDPNGRGLIGLDATMSELGLKDMGNIYFNYVVGGWNAESAEAGHLAYGGVFVSSYLVLSPKFEKASSLADPLFDQVFEAFMPARGGEAARVDELPSGERAEAIERAVRALGSMIGNTVSHEFGHTLGLANGRGPAEAFHNLEPGPNQIMDAGTERPFAERAELDPDGPAQWTPENLTYLREILPSD